MTIYDNFYVYAPVSGQITALDYYCGDGYHPRNYGNVSPIDIGGGGGGSQWIRFLTSAISVSTATMSDGDPATCWSRCLVTTAVVSGRLAPLAFKSGTVAYRAAIVAAWVGGFLNAASRDDFASPMIFVCSARI